MDLASFMTLYHLQRLFSGGIYGRMIVLDPLERLGEDAVMACFKVISRHFPLRTEKSLSQDDRGLSLDMNRAPPE
jgi:hypothetical protein